MSSKLTLSTILALLALLLLAIPTLAGGAATVTLDELPTEIRAGQTLHLTFTIRQHGQHLVDTFDGVGPVAPYLEAHNAETRETLRIEAYKPAGAAVGHYALDVTFPSAGTWEWRIEPAPFALLNEFEPLTVQEALPAATSTTATAPATLALPTVLRWGGVLLIALAIVLAFARQRQVAPRPATVE